jgi:hypothetical protein
MMNELTIKTSYDWRQKVKLPLDRVLMASMDAFNRNSVEACKHFVILMAQSASAATPRAKKKRPVISNPNFAHLLEKSQYKKIRRTNAEMARYFRFVAIKYQQPSRTIPIYGNKPGDISKVNRVGLAKKSWMWGLKNLAGSKPIAGTWEVVEKAAKNFASYTKINKLSYISKIMRSGFEQVVAEKATNKLMKSVERKMQKQFAVKAAI